jgi:asparagine synthase (glutamine-hydrolysing)
LSGVGADELFGGYPSFQEVPQLYYWARRAAIVPDFLRRMLARSLTFQKPIQVSQKLQDMFSIQPRLSWLAAMRRRLMSQHDLKQLGFQFDDLGLSPIGLPPKTMMQLPIESDDAGWTISVVESALYQGNTLLRDADANSMAHSLELRVPFLDQELIDFAHSIPGEIRFPKDGPRKFLLREAFGDVISDVIHKRPKTGFSLPIARWMLKQLRPLCEEGVNYVAMSGLVNKKGVKALWASFLADPNERSWTRAFSIVVLGHYLKNLDRYKSSHPLTTPKFVDKEWAGCSGSC